MIKRAYCAHIVCTNNVINAAYLLSFWESGILVCAGRESIRYQPPVIPLVLSIYWAFLADNITPVFTICCWRKALGSLLLTSSGLCHIDLFSNFTCGAATSMTKCWVLWAPGNHQIWEWSWKSPIHRVKKHSSKTLRTFPKPTMLLLGPNTFTLYFGHFCPSLTFL